MNELKIITNNFTPAKVDFNYEQVSAYLNTLLEKYKNLVFTEETVDECKKTLAELRKGQRSLDDFRKKTKKELTKSITEFEDQCKKLYTKFDEVITPLTDQADAFEEKRREEKRKQVQTIVDELIQEQYLNDKYASQLIIEDQYLNKTKTLKSIREELTTTAESLGIQQDKEEADKELIKARVELVNEKFGIELLGTNYIRLLEYEGINEILEKINKDAEILKQKLEEEQKAIEPEPKPTPTKQVKVPRVADEEIYVEKYEVEGTEGQLDTLEKFMDSAGLEWKIIDD